MADNDLIWRFTPSRTDPRVLEEIFVQRGPFLADIVDCVREIATTGNKHYILMIGPRGIGKTHLITLLHHRVTQDPALAEQVRIAWMLEDETITSSVQLLKRIYELLSDEYPAEFSRDWLESILEQPPDKIQKALELALIDKFKGKTLLLLIENLDLVFEGLGDLGQKKWRAFLQEHPFTSIVATSQRLFKSVKDREQPFFGFFAPKHLKPLLAPDAVELLGRIAKLRDETDLATFLETPEGRSRVRALHHLAGGNHRIYIILSGFITRDSLDELVGPFEKMADELTPYYQERMRWLTLQQRQVIEFLCMRESPCTPKEIARHLLASENSVSSQLKKLLELGYVLRSPRGRESLYELAEPLMRLASEVKEKRGKPLRLLVSFLRIWYRPDRLPELLEKAGTPSLRDHLRAAIMQSQSTPDPRLRILEKEIEKARSENQIQELLLMFEERAHARGAASDWSQLGYAHVELQNFQAALQAYNRVIEIDPADDSAWYNKGNVLYDLGRFDEAIFAYDKTIEILPTKYGAWCNKGNVLYDLGRVDEAIFAYDKAIEILPTKYETWCNKGNALYSAGRVDEAIFAYDKAIGIFPTDHEPWHNKGSTLRALGRFDDAIIAFDKAIEIFPTDYRDWHNKGIALYHLGRFDDAIKAFDQSRKVAPSSYQSFLHAVSLFALHRWERGFALLSEALAHRLRKGRRAVELIILLIQHNIKRAQQQQHVTRLIDVYEAAGELASLGDGLVRTLGLMDAEQLGKKALEVWRDVWVELGAGLPDLEIPIRIFRVGIAYLVRRDERALLDLVDAERRIARQALGLDEAMSIVEIPREILQVGVVQEESMEPQALAR